MLSEGFDMKIEKFTLLSLFFATLHTDNILHTLRGFLTYNAVSNTIIKTSKVMHAPNHSQWHLDPSHLSCRRCTNNTKIHKTYESYRVQYPRVTDSASDVKCSCGCFHPCVGYDAVVFGVLYPVLIGFGAWVTSWVTDDLTLCSCEKTCNRNSLTRMLRIVFPVLCSILLASFSIGDTDAIVRYFWMQNTSHQRETFPLWIWWFFRRPRFITRVFSFASVASSETVFGEIF